MSLENHLGKGTVYFRKNDWDALCILFNEAHTDPNWPKLLSSTTALERFTQSWDMSTWLGDGHVDVCVDRQTEHPIGYGTLERIEPALCPNASRSYEGGTYLLETVRGSLVNAQMKIRQRQAATTVYEADYLIYTVAEDNFRAKRALEKLDWNGTQITQADTTHPWHRFLQHKSWSTGTRLCVFIFPITTPRGHRGVKTLR